MTFSFNPCMAEMTYLVQIVNEPTRMDNTLDLILTNNDTLVNRVEIIPGISDHDAVFTDQPQEEQAKTTPNPALQDWPSLRKHCDNLSQR